MLYKHLQSSNYLPLHPTYHEKENEERKKEFRTYGSKSIREHGGALCLGLDGHGNLDFAIVM